jgi:hypothetical protein
MGFMKITMKEHLEKSQKIYFGDFKYNISLEIIKRCNIVALNNVHLCIKSRFSIFDNGENINLYTEHWDLDRILKFEIIDLLDLKDEYIEKINKGGKIYFDFINSFHKKNLLIKNVKFLK